MGHTIEFLKARPELLLIIGLLLPTHKFSASDLAPFDSNGSGGGGGGSAVVQHTEIKVGAVVDVGLHICIQMAISEFYASKPHYKTRLSLHTRDSMNDSPSSHAISSAIYLLETVKVQALVVGPETFLETKSLGAILNNAGVPIFSFASILSGSAPGQYPFIVEIKQDENLQFKAIADILRWHQWRTVSVIYENTDDGKGSLPFLIGSLQERNIRVSYRKALSPFSTDDQILDQLHELAIVQQTVFIVHLSPTTAYSLFSTAKKLGMMKEGYAWIVTDKTMNQYQSMDWEVVESMQGVVGLKARIPSSNKLRDFSLRWKKEFYSENGEFRELDVPGVWAYDTIWALAKSIETLGQEHTINAPGRNFYSGKEILDEVVQRRFTGLSGEFEIVNGRLHSETFEIVNVIGKGERSVGFWTSKNGIVKGRSLSSSAPKQVGLDEAIVWPGITTTAPRGQLMLTGGRNLTIAVAHNEGFEQFISLTRNSDTNITSITGFCADVFLAAVGLLHYQVPFEFIPYVGPNGTSLDSYSNLVQDLYHQKYDGAIGDITITEDRSLFVDFTSTFTDLGIGTITKREDNDIWLFTRPLHPYLWFTVVVFLVLIGTVVSVIESCSNNQKFQGSVGYRIGTILWFGCSTFFYAHREKLTSNLSRFVVIVWLFAVLILTSTYTATLSAMLTLQKIRQGSGQYVGTQGNSIIGGTIVSNLNFKDDRLQLYGSPEEYADALSRGIKHGGVDAIIDEIPYLKVFLAKYGADYTMVASQSTTNGFGFAFQKKYAQLVSDLSKAIIKLREEKKLEAMENTWLRGGSSFMPENPAAKPNILSLRSFGGLFIICASCCGFAILIFLVSIIRANLDYMRNIMMVVRDGGILAYMLKLIVHIRQIPIH